MSGEKTYIGAVCAHCPRSDGGKAAYPRIGSAFEDTEGRLSIKIDSIPVSRDWTGWLNIFPPKDSEPF